MCITIIQFFKIKSSGYFKYASLVRSPNTEKKSLLSPNKLQWHESTHTKEEIMYSLVGNTILIICIFKHLRAVALSFHILQQI